MLFTGPWRKIRQDRRERSLSPLRSLGRGRLLLEWLEDRLAPAQFVVNTTNPLSVGSGLTGSLTYCVAQANASAGADTITFDSSVFGVGASQARGITLVAQLPTISDDLTIDGPAGMRLFVERSLAAGVPDFRLFDVSPSVQLTLRNLTVANGVASSGGAIYNAGQLLTENCRFTNNTATGANTGGGAVHSVFASATFRATQFDNNHSTNTDRGLGGAVFSYHSALLAEDSTFASNSATLLGGGLLVEAGTTATLLVNCTLSGNSALYGGGVSLLANANVPTITLSFCTFANNSAPWGGADGFLYRQFASGAILEYQNCLFASTGGNNLGGLSGSTLRSLGYNISRDSTGGLDQVGDLPSTDPRLGPLVANGGPVLTHALLPGSPALDAAIQPAALLTDARGIARPQNGRADLGAFEARAYSFQGTAGFAQLAVVATTFANPLSVQLLEGGQPLAGVSISFTVTGGTANFPGGTTTSLISTDASGMATSPLLTAGTVAGPVTVVAQIGNLVESFNLFSVPDQVADYRITPVGPVAPGKAFTLEITPVDRFGNRSPSGLGVVHFTSSDPLAELPADFNFLAQNESPSDTYLVSGFRLGTTGTQSITLTEVDGTSTSATTQVVVTNQPPQNIELVLNAVQVREGEPFLLEGFFADPGGMAQAHTVVIDWGDGTNNVVNLEAGVFSFRIGHAYVGGLPASNPALLTIRATITDSLGQSGQASTTISVINAVPQVFAGPDTFLNVGRAFTRRGFYLDAGDSATTARVDYGDGTPSEVLALNADGTFTLAHTYPIEGSFTVTVTVDDGRGGVGMAQFQADVLLPGVVVVAKKEVLGGTVVTVSVPGASATLAHQGPSTAELIVAVVPIITAAALDVSFTLTSGEVMTAAYDIRALHVSTTDILVIHLHYHNDDADQPIVTYFDPVANRQVVIASSVYRVDPVGKVITLVLSSATTPSVLALGGTVFTISVAISLPVLPPEGNAPAPPSTSLPLPVQALFAGPTTRTTLAAEGSTAAQTTGVLPTGSSGQVNLVRLAASESLAASTGGSEEEVGTAGIALSSEENLLGPLPPAPSSLMAFPALTVTPSRAIPFVEEPPADSMPPIQEEEGEAAANAVEVADEVFERPAQLDRWQSGLLLAALAAWTLRERRTPREEAATS